MRLLDERYTACPFYGSRRMTAWLNRHGEAVNRKRVQRLLRIMGLEAIYPKPKLSASGMGQRVYPYLLRGLTIDRPGQVWSADITYVPLRQGFLYLVAILDWYSRYVLAWKLSNSLDETFCVEALEEALAQTRPEIFNTDQGVQFTGTGLHRPVTGGRGGDQHGWQRAGPRQRVRGAPLACTEVRGDLPQGLCGGSRL